MNRRSFLKCTLAVAGAAAISLPVVSSVAEAVTTAPEVVPGIGVLRVLMQGVPDILFAVPRGEKFWEVGDGAARYLGEFTFEATQRCDVLGAVIQVSDPGIRAFGIHRIPIGFSRPRCLVEGDIFTLKPTVTLS